MTLQRVAVAYSRRHGRVIAITKTVALKDSREEV